MTDFGREYGWIDVEELPSKEFTCYNCGNNICSNEGYRYGNLARAQFGGSPDVGRIYICHKCKVPTYFNEGGNQIPGIKFGPAIEYLPENVETMYNEARNCYSVNAFTSVVLCCRKILMSVACELGEDEGKRFVEYVNYLDTKHYIPINTKPFVDKIRLLGNDGTHKLENRTKEDAELALNFTSILLKNIYEMPKILENS